MIKSYVSLALLSIIAVVCTYIVQFYFRLNFVLSDSVSDWVNFSNFVGGLLAPIFSFLSFILLLKSVNLQSQANAQLLKDARTNAKKDSFQTFETHFFSMLEAQRITFDNFKLEIPLNNQSTVFVGVEGVIQLENYIQQMRNNGASNSQITEMLYDIDSSERIYNTIRIFYNITKMITERLENSQMHSIEERKSQFQTLINFTEFSLLRLVLISMQFCDYPPATYIKNNKEFTEVLIALGLEIDPY